MAMMLYLQYLQPHKNEQRKTNEQNIYLWIMSDC